jgi:hypothetical protein
MANSLMTLLTGVYMGTWVAGAVSGVLFSWHMKRHHAAYWEQLHRPATQNGIKRSWNVMRWMQKRGYANLSDPKLTKLGDWSLWLTRAFLAVFGFYIALFLLALLIR